MIGNFLDKIDKLDLAIIGQSNKRKFLLILTAMVFFFGIVFKLNIMTPMWSDDYMYSFIFSTSDTINSISDLIYSQYLHYMHWGGRSVGHTIVQVLLMIDPLWADFINSLAYIALVTVMYYHMKGNNKEHNVSLFVIINLMVWFFAPYFGETILWITGSGNYMWCMLFILLFLLPYRLYENEKNTTLKNIAMCLLMFFGGIVAGWTNENVAIAMIIMCCLWIVLYKLENWKIPKWAIIGVLGAIIGYCLLVLAPGNFERLIAAGANERTYGLFFVYFKFNMYTARLANMIGTIVLLSMVLVVLVFQFQELKQKYFILSLIIYLAGVLVPVYVMIPSPIFPDRAWFGTVMFSIIIFGTVFYNMNYNLGFTRSIRSLLLSLFVVAFVFNFYKSYKDVKLIQNMWVEREFLIKQAIINGQDTIRVPALNLPNSKYAMFDAEFASKEVSKYYKANIKIVDN